MINATATNLLSVIGQQFVAPDNTLSMVSANPMPTHLFVLVVPPVAAETAERQTPPIVLIRNSR